MDAVPARLVFLRVVVDPAASEATTRVRFAVDREDAVVVVGELLFDYLDVQTLKVVLESQKGAKQELLRMTVKPVKLRDLTDKPERSKDKST